MASSEFNAKQIENLVKVGIILDTSPYRKYKVAGGATVPNLISPLVKCPIGRPPFHYYMPNDLKAEVYNASDEGAEEKFNPVSMTVDRANWSDIGIKIDAKFNMRTMSIIQEEFRVNTVQRRLVQMLDAMRRQLDHLCIQNLIGKLPETLKNVDILAEFQAFNMGTINDRYNRATTYKALPLTRYIPVNATYPHYAEGPQANTIQAEKLTIGKIMLAAEHLSDTPGQPILIVKRKYMYGLSVEKNVINTNTTIASDLNLNAEITTYQSVGGVLVIGIPDAHFPDLSSGVAHWVDADNGGGAIHMLTTDSANEKNVSALDYGIMFMGGGESLAIGEESSLYAPTNVDDGFNATNSSINLNDNAPMSLSPQYKWLGMSSPDVPGTELLVRFSQIYWFSRPRNNNIVVIELNPTLQRINEI